MKYRLTRSEKKHYPHPSGRLVRLKGSNTLRPLPPNGFYRLSDPEPYLLAKNKKRITPRERCRMRLYRLRARRANKKERLTVPLIGGLCLGALTVTTVSAVVLFLIMFAPLSRPYTTVTVPDLTGKDPFSLSAEELPFNLILQYETNPEVPSGLVISQAPRGGVSRRIYSEHEYPELVLTVSRAPTPYSLEDLSGLSQREAELILKNQSLTVSIQSKESAQPGGTVLSTVPPAGTPLYEGDTVTLLLSREKKEKLTYVPELLGLSESEARERLQYAGLSAGEIRYTTSSAPAGTVIEQQYAAHTVLRAHTEVSLQISLGDHYSLRLVPDLYGKNEEEAAALLREYGLTVGSIYTVSNAAPKGTVISQSPLPGTPLTSSLWSVDLYVSSSLP